MFRILIAAGFSSSILAANPFLDGFRDSRECRFCWMFERRAADAGVEEVAVVEIPVAKAAVKERSYRVLLFTATWCGPCQVVKRDFDWLRSGGWTIGDSFDNHIQVVDVDDNKAVWDKWRGGSNLIPLAVLVSDGKLVARVIPTGGRALITLYNDNR